MLTPATLTPRSGRPGERASVLRPKDRHWRAIQPGLSRRPDTRHSLPRPRRAGRDEFDDQLSDSSRDDTSSTRPHSSAVGASIALPTSPSAAVRCRPMRRVRLAVPPAPGIRPSDTSGSADSRARIGDHPAGERRHLDPAAERRTVDAHLDPVTEPFDESGRAARQPGDVGRDRIRTSAELAEVSAAAERRAVAADDHFADRVVDQRDRQRAVEFIAQLHGDRVVAVRPIERERQPTAVPLDQHRRPVGFGVGLRRCGRAPRCELGASLEHRVHRRFCGERGSDRQRLALSQ